MKNTKPLFPAMSTSDHSWYKWCQKERKFSAVRELLKPVEFVQKRGPTSCGRPHRRWAEQETLFPRGKILTIRRKVRLAALVNHTGLKILQMGSIFFFFCIYAQPRAFVILMISNTSIPKPTVAIGLPKINGRDPIIGSRAGVITSILRRTTKRPFQTKICHVLKRCSKLLSLDDKAGGAPLRPSSWDRCPNTPEPSIFRHVDGQDHRAAWTGRLVFSDSRI